MKLSKESIYFRMSIALFTSTTITGYGAALIYDLYPRFDNLAYTMALKCVGMSIALCCCVIGWLDERE